MCSSDLKLEKVAATDKISVGDTVTTAGQLVDGVKSILPRSLLIGTIVDVLDPEDFTRSGRIIPAVDLDRLESVLVVTGYEGPRTRPAGDATPPPEPDVTDAPTEPTPAPRPRSQSSPTP